MPTKKVHEKFCQLLNVETDWLFGQYLPTLRLESNNWQMAATCALSLNYRFVSLWAQDLGENIELNIILELQAAYLLLRTLVDIKQLTIPSFTPYFPAANRLERHTRDMFGLEFSELDNRRWTRHQAWSNDQWPLRKNFLAAKTSATTPPDSNYPFLPVTGAGICEIPVGPVHAGIIEPGHFRFHVAGEDIITLEEHLGYTHKGIEKIAEGREIAGLVKLAGRVSGDSTVSHAWAACAALENASHAAIPERALYLRAIMCERERVANHLCDFAAICNDVAYTFPYYQLTRLKELWLRLNAKVYGHRLMMDGMIPGGVKVDLDVNCCQALNKQAQDFKQELNELLVIFEAHSGLHDRVKNTGILTVDQAKLFGVLGYVARASGQKLDLRRDLAYPPYNQLKIKVPVFNTGDVLARLRIRFQELLVSLDLIENLLNTLPSGSIQIPWLAPKQATEGIGLIEGWRGEIVTFVRLGGNGLVERFFPRDPSWFSWPALERLVLGNIVPDFPVCNKSINGSYSGVDL